MQFRPFHAIALTVLAGSTMGPSTRAIADDEFTIWLNAFIPETIQGLTKPAPAGPHKGKTAIQGPLPISDCFLTDQRTFSDKRDASSRMHMELTIKITGDVVKIISTSHRCDATIEIDCEDGAEEGNKSAATDRIIAKLQKDKVVDGKVQIKFNCASNNPLFTGSPDIDAVGEITIDVKNKSVAVDGKVEPFPAFEMYAEHSGKSAKLFAHEPQPGSSPWKLPGAPNRQVNATVSLK
jgi:hypothetical protein